MMAGSSLAKGVLGRGRSSMSIDFRRYRHHALWLASAVWVAPGWNPVTADNDVGKCFAQLVAAIDIGHFRSSPGARDVFGRAELDYNIELAARIEAELVRSGIGGVVLVNRSLDMTSLPARPMKAFCAGADLFVSVHHDNVDENLKTGAVDENGRRIRSNDLIEGYTVYFSSQNRYADLSFALGLSVAEALRASGVLPATPYRNIIADELREPVSADLNVFDYQKLKVSRTSPIPAILLEAGFLSNRNDVRRLRNAEYRQRIALGIVDGLKAMCARHPGLAGLNRTAGNRRMQCG
jgi:N-acetylmuramoyl-L-alanine amidase